MGRNSQPRTWEYFTSDRLLDVRTTWFDPSSTVQRPPYCYRGVRSALDDPCCICDVCSFQPTYGASLSILKLHANTVSDYPCMAINLFRTILSPGQNVVGGNIFHDRRLSMVYVRQRSYSSRCCARSTTFLSLTSAYLHLTSSGLDRQYEGLHSIILGCARRTGSSHAHPSPETRGLV